MLFYFAKYTRHVVPAIFYTILFSLSNCVKEHKSLEGYHIQVLNTKNESVEVINKFMHDNSLDKYGFYFVQDLNDFSYKVFVGDYTSFSSAKEDLFDIRKKINDAWITNNNNVTIIVDNKTLPPSDIPIPKKVITKLADGKESITQSGNASSKNADIDCSQRFSPKTYRPSEVKEIINYYKQNIVLKEFDVTDVPPQDDYETDSEYRSRVSRKKEEIYNAMRSGFYSKGHDSLVVKCPIKTLDYDVNTERILTLTFDGFGLSGEWLPYFRSGPSYRYWSENGKLNPLKIEAEHKRVGNRIGARYKYNLGYEHKKQLRKYILDGKIETGYEAFVNAETDITYFYWKMPRSLAKKYDIKKNKGYFIFKIAACRWGFKLYEFSLYFGDDEYYHITDLN